MNNVSGANTYGGPVTLGSDSRINSDSGTLTLNNGTITGSGYDLSVGGAGKHHDRQDHRHRNRHAHEGWRRARSP